MLVSIDLDSKEFLEWADRGPFMSKLIGDHWQRSRDGTSASESISAVGYSDLSGQLRATLDVFSDVQTADISLLAALLVGFLLIVGPLDYFLWVRKWKLAKITWWTLALASIFSCVGIAMVNQRWKPIEPRMNEVTLWDFDYSTQQSKAGVGFTCIQALEARTASAGQPCRSASQRQPRSRSESIGKEFPVRGSVDSIRRSPPIEECQAIELNSPPRAPRPTLPRFEDMDFSVDDVGIPVAGTKAFQAEWTTPWYLPESSSQIKLIPGTDLLEGQWSNPLSVDLRDAVAMYKNWAYALPTRLPPGQKVEFSLSSTPRIWLDDCKTRIVEGNEQGSPWEPASRSDVDRLMDMILFHKAPGARATTLSHQLFGDCDLSELLRMDRAIVVGRVDGPTWKLDALQNENAIEVKDGMRKTWVRFVVPINK